MKIKTYNATQRTSAPLKKLIDETLEHHDQYKGSYFWSPASHASGRRFNEKRFPMQNYNVNTKDGLLTIRPYYRESTGNCYYSLDIHLGGEKKSIKALKKLLKG